MQFNYSPINNCRLTQDERNLLLDVDSFGYPIGTFQELADLHNTLTVYTSAEKKTRDFSYVISASERQQKIVKLNQKINDLLDESDNLPFPGFNADRSEREAYNRKKDELEFEIWTSRKSLELYENASDLHNGNYQIVGSNLVLGEYNNSTEKAITLYMNNIRRNGSNPELTAIVYVREMMHAYLGISPNGIISEIEEPIVEYAMLKFFELFNSGALLNQAEREVEDKKYVFGIAHYGFGHCLFHNPNGIDWLEDYKNAKGDRLSRTDPNVIPYLNYWNKGTYPFNDEIVCLNALYIALHFGTIPATPLTVARPSMSRVVWNVINDYAQRNPTATLQDIQNAFNGVHTHPDPFVEDWNIAVNHTNRNGELDRRYCINDPDDRIKTASGDVAVSSQWYRNGNFADFCRIARGLGYVTPIPNNGGTPIPVNPPTIDFLNNFIGLFSTSADLIKHVVETSLFFSPEIVDTQYGKMVAAINGVRKIPVRFSTDRNAYYDRNGQRILLNNKADGVQISRNQDIYYVTRLNIRIEIDTDGNREVRNAIRRYTGAVISNGQNSTIQYARISHIFDQAFDPLFFTSLWNIAIVPAYCNDLLERPGLTNSVITDVKETFKAIAWEKYDLDTKFRGLGLEQAEIDNLRPDQKYIDSVSLFTLRFLP